METINLQNMNQYDDEEVQISLKDYYRIIYRGRWYIILSLVVVMIITTIYTFTAPEVYEASAKIIVESKGTMERALFDMTYMANQSTLITNQVEILKSRYLAENVVRYLAGTPYRDSLTIFQPDDEGLLLPFREQVEWLMGNLNVTPKKDTDVIEIVFSASTPWEAKTICNAIAERYLDLNREFNRSEFTELRKFLEHQIVKKGEELKLSEDALKRFKQEEKLVSLDEETQELVSRFAEVESKLEETRVELNAALEAKRTLEEQLEHRKKALSVETVQISSPLLKELQNEYARLVAQKVKYETLIEQDRIDPQNFSKEIASMDEKIQAIQKKLREEAMKISNTSMVTDPLQLTQEIVSQLLDIETKIKTLSSQLKSLQEIVNEYDLKLSVLPDKALELARLERRLKVDQATFIMMNEKLEETKISEAGQKENVRILDYAIAPLYPVKPKKKLNMLLGLLIGLGLGVGVTFLIEYLDNSIKSMEELEKLGKPVLAAIPVISSEEIENKMKEMAERNSTQDLSMLEGQQIETRLVTHFDPKSPISEAYRTLRTNIHFSKTDKKIKSLLVTSSGPKEGKSTTVANLAITHAQMGFKTVIVDTDLRRPVIHHIFGLEKDMGVTNYIVNKTDIKDIIKPSLVDNLYIIPSGPLPPNPAELLASDKMKQFINELKETFDMVIFDSPPVIAVTDAQLISSETDGSVLVVKSEQTNRDMLRRTLLLLENVNADLLGFIYNHVLVGRGYGYDYYYYYHYYQYYGSDLKRRKKGKLI
ncbi:MAG: polysaccharide biosynthesis tyrosine autokinase [Calditrichia bacterium]